MKQLTQERFWAACDAKMSRPVELRKADLNKPFVYDREFGFFYVNFGYHQQAMALLYAWHKGFDRSGDLMIANGWRDSSKAADALMEDYDGIAMKSGVTSMVKKAEVMAFSPSKLNQEEKDFFGLVVYVGNYK
jgi:hypothetical protein